ncbi:hypothetical protein ACT6QH_01305 [Xanthobacter sp. TB0139]|uniref:hypothetical protein n=1 Tax=Xanthobacter sp. TB0139 TaxID=3459178 RepID=UPI00403A4E49
MKTTLRDSLVWILRPVWRPFEKMLERRVAPLEAELRARLDALDARSAHTEQELYRRAGTLEGQMVQVQEQVQHLGAQLHRLEKGWRIHSPTFVEAVAHVVELEHNITMLRQELAAPHASQPAQERDAP